jgi:putative oxidoreductase
MRWLSDPRLSVLFRLFVGVAFVWAGIVKMSDPAAFQEGLVNYRMFPAALIAPIAVTVPPIEIVAGLGLILGFLSRGSALIVTGMLVVFTIAIVQAITRGIDIECGCFGAGGPEAASIGWTEVVRDLVMLGAAVHVLFYDRGILSLERLRARASREP